MFNPEVDNLIAAIKRFGSGFQESVNCRSKFEMLRGYHGTQEWMNWKRAPRSSMADYMRLAISTARRLVKPAKVEWLASGKSNQAHPATYSLDIDTINNIIQ